MAFSCHSVPPKTYLSVASQSFSKPSIHESLLKREKKVFQKLICNWLYIKHAKLSFAFLGVKKHWAATLMYFMSMLKVLQKGAVTFTPTPFAYFTSFHHCMIGGTQDESVEKIPFCQYNTIPSYSLPSLRY